MDHIRPDGRGRGMEGIGREKGSLGRGTKEGRNRLKMRVLYCRWHRCNEKIEDDRNTKNENN